MEYTVIMTCPMCGQEHCIDLDAESSAGYLAYMMGSGLIQEALPNLSASEREFLKTGYCPACQNLLFNVDTSNTRIVALNECL